MTFTEILTEARRLVKADSTSYPTSEITESANRALDRAVALIREAEGRWQWDDTNNTDLPIATTALVDGQQDYELDPTHYEMERVEVQDELGGWHRVLPIDQADIYDQSITDFLSTAGTPQYYDKIGRSIMLYPTPSYSQDDSLKVWYKRGPSYFTVSDTTKTPGFNALFHRLIPLHSAYDYAFINQLSVAPSLQDKILTMEDDLINHYSRRDRDDKIRLRVRTGNFR
jgi:hypothetical protein